MEAYVERKYKAWTKYWPEFDFPDWGDIELVFEGSKEAWGGIEWLENGGLRLTLDPACKKSASLARSCLFHEMTHIVCGWKFGHGKKFYSTMLEALNRGAIYERVI